MPIDLPQVQHIYQNHHLDSTRWNDYRPREGDIIVSTSYKSGTTWTQEIVLSLIFLGQDVASRDEVSIWIDRRPVPLDQVMASVEAQAHRRVLKTHLPLDGLPFYSEVKYVVVGRDARDVFMSLWNHYSNYTEFAYEHWNDTPGRVDPPLPPCPTDIHQFWRDWITRGWFPWESEGYPFWGNLHHTRTWWRYRHLENILFVHYGDLLHDLKREIRRIADFLGIPVSDESIESVAARVSLTSMRGRAEGENPHGPAILKNGANAFFFKGTNGRWKDVLTADELELYKKAVTRVLTPDAARWLENGRATQTEAN